jgi:hypothetical protein
VPQKTQQPTGRGCLTALAIVVLIIIGVIVHACSGPSTPVGQSVGTGPTVAASPSYLTPTPAPSPSSTHARHRHRRHHHHHHVAAPQPSCYPLSDEGTCYEPGEFCRDSDHGATGLAGDGEKIACEDNDGWRWEPV